MLKFALVGCGRIAQRHAELLGGGHIESATLVAVCDTERERADKLASKYGVPAYENMDEMMAIVDADVAVVLTPSGLHAKHVIKIAKHGKHILVEKPMALTIDDADKMIQACDEARVRLFVVKQNRFNVPVRKLRESLMRGRFGKLVLGTVRVRWCRTQEYYDQDAWRGTWAHDGGVLANQASHHVDLLEWMMGTVDSVFAKATTALSDIETEDTIVVTLKFRNGALGVVEATTATRPKDLEGSLSILGETGSVEISGFAVNKVRTWEFKDEDPEDEEVRAGAFSVNPPDVYGFGHKNYYEHVVDCLINGSPHLVDGLEGRKSLELISAIYESVESGEEVQMRFMPKKCRLGMREDQVSG